MLKKTSTKRTQRKERKAIANLVMLERKNRKAMTEWDRCGGSMIDILHNRIRYAAENHDLMTEADTVSLRKHHRMWYYRWKHAAFALRTTLDFYRHRSLPLR